MFTAGIIGAGSIGAIKPDNIDSPETHNPLTHAHAIYKNQDIDLKWIYDVNKEKNKLACARWNCGSTPKRVDVIVVATPTDIHLKTVEMICNQKKALRPKIIVLEKPAGNNLNEATRIDYLTKKAGIKVVVNYGRRFCPSLSAKLSELEIIQSVVFYYTRGFIRDGSHAIDLFNQFAGTFLIGDILDDPVIDYSEEDPTYAAHLQYTNCDHIYMIPCDGRNFDIFEMHVMTNKKRYIFGDHFKKIGVSKAIQENTYGNYLSMPIPRMKSFQLYRIDLERSLEYLYCDILRWLDAKKDSPESELKCTMPNALKVHSVFEKLFIKRSLLNGRN